MGLSSLICIYVHNVLKDSGIQQTVVYVTTKLKALSGLITCFVNNGVWEFCIFWLQLFRVMSPKKTGIRVKKLYSSQLNQSTEKQMGVDFIDVYLF